MIAAISDRNVMREPSRNVDVNRRVSQPSHSAGVEHMAFLGQAGCPNLESYYNQDAHAAPAAIEEIGEK